MSKKQVGTMPSGAAVYEIGLANGKGMSVNILTYGAIIKDIFVPDKDGNIGNVVLGQDTFEDVREKAFCNAMLVGRVANRIKEGTRERTQIFEGVVIKKQGGGNRETFTVRKISSGIGVEKTWPINSPNVEDVTVVRMGKVRRAKLFYLRGLSGKKAKVKEKIVARTK